ncbi:MAG: bifunctional precorrin-2 dehydrogenase/sirohydrochlorin ferrochelatase [Caulobacterales bacterium]
MEAFPAFFPLSGRRIVIAGEGEGAEAKVRLLASSPATLTRVTGAAALEPESYAGAVLAFVAGDDEAFRQGAAAAARAAGAAVNVVDHPSLSDFHAPAIIDRGQVVVAIGTAGAAPMLAALLRAELEAKIPEGLGRIAALLGRFREEIRAAYPDLAQRRAFLRGVLEGPAAQAASAGDEAEAARRLRAEIAAGGAAAGRVWLIVAPSSRDLLALRAARALAMADILALAEGVDDGVAALARRDASWRTLADIDDDASADGARQGLQVVVVAGIAEIERRAAVLARLGAAHEILTPAGTA